MWYNPHAQHWSRTAHEDYTLQKYTTVVFIRHENLIKHRSSKYSQEPYLYRIELLMEPTQDLIVKTSQFKVEVTNNQYSTSQYLKSQDFERNQWSNRELKLSVLDAQLNFDHQVFGLHHNESFSDVYDRDTKYEGLSNCVVGAHGDCETFAYLFQLKRVVRKDYAGASSEVFLISPAIDTSLALDLHMHFRLVDSPHIEYYKLEPCHTGNDRSKFLGVQCEAIDQCPSETAVKNTIDYFFPGEDRILECDAGYHSLVQELGMSDIYKSHTVEHCTDNLEIVNKTLITGQTRSPCIPKTCDIQQMYDASLFGYAYDDFWDVSGSLSSIAIDNTTHSLLDFFKSPYRDDFHWDVASQPEYASMYDNPVIQDLKDTIYVGRFYRNYCQPGFVHFYTQKDHYNLTCAANGRINPQVSGSETTYLNERSICQPLKCDSVNQTYLDSLVDTIGPMILNETIHNQIPGFENTFHINSYYIATCKEHYVHNSTYSYNQQTNNNEVVIRCNASGEIKIQGECQRISCLHNTDSTLQTDYFPDAGNLTVLFENDPTIDARFMEVDWTTCQQFADILTHEWTDDISLMHYYGDFCDIKCKDMYSGHTDYDPLDFVMLNNRNYPKYENGTDFNTYTEAALYCSDKGYEVNKRGNSGTPNRYECRPELCQPSVMLKSDADLDPTYGPMTLRLDLGENGENFVSYYDHLGFTDFHKKSYYVAECLPGYAHRDSDSFDKFNSITLLYIECGGDTNLIYHGTCEKLDCNLNIDGQIQDITHTSTKNKLSLIDPNGLLDSPDVIDEVVCQSTLYGDTCDIACQDPIQYQLVNMDDILEIDSAKIYCSETGLWQIRNKNTNSTTDSFQCILKACELPTNDNIRNADLVTHQITLSSGFTYDIDYGIEYFQIGGTINATCDTGHYSPDNLKPQTIKCVLDSSNQAVWEHENVCSIGVCEDPTEAYQLATHNEDRFLGTIDSQLDLPTSVLKREIISYVDCENRNLALDSNTQNNHKYSYGSQCNFSCAPGFYLRYLNADDPTLDDQHALYCDDDRQWKIYNKRDLQPASYTCERKGCGDPWSSVDGIQNDHAVHALTCTSPSTFNVGRQPKYMLHASCTLSCHIGYYPRNFISGSRNPVWATKVTCDLDSNNNLYWNFQDLCQIAVCGTNSITHLSHVGAQIGQGCNKNYQGKCRYFCQDGYINVRWNDQSPNLATPGGFLPDINTNIAESTDRNAIKLKCGPQSMTNTMYGIWEHIHFSDTNQKIECVPMKIENAVWAGQHTILLSKALIHGADPNTLFADGSPLIFKVLEGILDNTINPEFLPILITQPSINLDFIDSTSGTSLLHLASQIDNSDTVRHLLDAGNNPNDITVDLLETPLMLAVQSCLLNNVQEFFKPNPFNYTINVDQKNLHGNTILHMAVEHCSTTAGLILKIAEQFPTIYDTNAAGLTPLAVAVQSNNDGIILDELIQSEANVNWQKPDKSEPSLLCQTIINNYQTITTKFLASQKVKQDTIIDCFFHVGMESDEAKNLATIYQSQVTNAATDISASKGDIAGLVSHVALGKNFNKVSDTEFPLYNAIRNNLNESVYYLLEYGQANPNEVLDSGGNNMIQICIITDADLSIVEHLIDFGIDVKEIGIGFE